LSNELTSFSYAVLVLVGAGGAGPHDLVRMARQGRIYSPWAESQWYAEPKRLAKLGYLNARKEPGRTRERTHYTLTTNGRRAVADWVPEPTPLPRIQNEGIVRVLAADLVGEEPVVASLQALRIELADVLARLDVAEAVAETLPHRRKYLLLNHRLSRRLVAAFEEWIDDVERELGSRGARRARARSPRTARTRRR
jgi:PadR family transcriptional regulator, regulatory protein AphA